MSTRPLWCISLAAAIVGCGGHTLDVGATDAEPGAGNLRPDAGAGGPTGPVWNGILENGQLSNGSNRLTMRLSVGTDGGATGTLLLGDGALLPSPTDPNVGYPPGAQFATGPLGFFEGFAYTMLDGRLSGSTLTFRVAEAELWTQWCALQTSYPTLRDQLDGGPIYQCIRSYDPVPNSGPSGCSLPNPSNAQDPIPIDCGKAELCGTYACLCSATGCRGQSLSLSAVDLSLDLVITGSTADGTISGELGDHDVHFVRAQ